LRADLLTCSGGLLQSYLLENANKPGIRLTPPTSSEEGRGRGRLLKVHLKLNGTFRQLYM